MEKVNPIDMAKARALESDLRAAEMTVRAKVDGFQVFIDELFTKHQMVKGRDRLEEDGTIIRGEANK